MIFSIRRQENEANVWYSNGYLTVTQPSGAHAMIRAESPDEVEANAAKRRIQAEENLARALRDEEAAALWRAHQIQAEIDRRAQTTQRRAHTAAAKKDRGW